jgi:hypothetical protein
VTESESVSPLIDELFDSFAGSGMTKVMLPPGRRAEVAQLLTRLMASHELLGAYTAALKAERQRRGEAIEMRLLGMAGLDIEDERIAREGFGWLTDDQLADLALCPEAVGALFEYFSDPQTEPGDWFYDAVTREEIPPLDDAVRARIVAPFLDALGKDPQPSAAPVVPFRPGGERARTRWVGPLLALAASVLVAFFLGTQVRRGTEGREVLLAQAVIRGDVTRGVEDVALDVTNGGTRQAFVTVVGLAPGRRTQAFHYRVGNRYIGVPPRETVAVANLPPEFAGTTVVIVVLSDVPAGEPIRLNLSPTASPENAQELTAQLHAALEALGIASDIRVRPFPATKP